MKSNKEREFKTEDGKTYRLYENKDCGYFVTMWNSYANFWQQVSPFYMKKGNAERWIRNNLKEVK